MHSHIYILVHGAAMALYMFLPKHAAIIEVSHVAAMLTLHCIHCPVVFLDVNASHAVTEVSHVCRHAHMLLHPLSIECLLVSTLCSPHVPSVVLWLGNVTTQSCSAGTHQLNLFTCCMFCCPMGLFTVLRANLLLWRVSSSYVFALCVNCCF